MIEPCYRCKNMFDSGEALHYNCCRVYGLCVDCVPYCCAGDDFEEIEDPILDIKRKTEPMGKK